MENKQKVVLGLMRAMSELISQLIFLSHNFEKTVLKHYICNARIHLDNFEYEFIKKDTKKDEEEKEDEGLDTNG